MVALPLVTTTKYDQITFNMIKVNLSIILGLLIVISHVIMVYFTHGTINVPELFIYIIILGLFIYIYRNQLFMNEVDYLNNMKEVHSNEILISSKMINNISNKSILEYANFILSNSIKEISFIDNIINKKN
jgi:hypothetical protein